MIANSMQSKRNVHLNYYLFLPEGYETSRKTYPLILFLHGAGERGDSIEELDKVLIHGIPRYIESNPNFPFMVLIPQCPTYSYWPMQVENLNVLLDEILSTYRVDPDRVYITGLSMGGFGTWYMAYQYPERFAAIAPVCGAGIPSSIERLKDLPIWVFHGDKDPIIPVHESEILVKRIQAAGGNIRFTRYPDVGHDSWVKAYGSDELYAWFLRHKRGKESE